jgi:hypothetical protein
MFLFAAGSENRPASKVKRPEHEADHLLEFENIRSIFSALPIHKYGNDFTFSTFTLKLLQYVVTAWSKV